MNGAFATDPGIVHAHISHDGRLDSADRPLLDLQNRAGGALGEIVAIPALASIGRLAARLNVVISRSVTVADGTDDVEMWVHARPRAGEVDMTLSGWERVAARPPFENHIVSRNDDFMRATADWSFELDADLCITRIVALDATMAGPDLSPYVGRKLAAMVELLTDEEGDMPILTGLAKARGFVGQSGRLRPFDHALVMIDAMALVDTGGVVTALQGTMSLVHDQAMDAPVAAVSASDQVEDDTKALFGRRLEQVLRLPLNRIIANADSINAQQDGPIRRDYVHYAADIANAGRHMLGLVEDLVELQTVESADFQPAREVIDLADIARKAGGLVAVRAQEKSIRIDRPGEDEHLAALGDYRRVLQILVNLIGNAVRYSPEGSMVWIRTEVESDSATVIVADQGRGIDPTDHERIFERFERLNATEGGGSGLGLYISRSLARAMGGDISVDSAAGQGARFMLTLPRS